MVFSSLIFIFGFLPVFLIIDWLVPREKKWTADVRNAVLFGGSLVFYAWGEPLYVLLMLAVIGINYMSAIQISGAGRFSHQGKTKRRVLFILTLVFDIGLLFFFKYVGFVILNLNRILYVLGLPLMREIHPMNPVGISFYTFQIISYIVDVYYRRYPVERNVLTMGTYVAMFPQLIAGPIVQYPEVRDSLKKRQVTWLTFDRGLKQFIMGLGCKVLIANRIGILWNDLGRIGYESISTPLAWIGAFAYSFQIYFDFMGYSLMAIGLGRMLGFYLPENFRDPYASPSVSEFWRRWHVTLGRWFKNYLYIPLGGSHQGKLKTIRNTLIVWLFTGLWHGADWNFLIWGLLFFVLIMIEKGFLGKVLKKVPVLSVPYMLLVIPVSWVIFAISDMDLLGVYLLRLFPFLPGSEGVMAESMDFLRYLGTYWPIFVLAVLLCIPPLRRGMHNLIRKPLATPVCLLIFFLSVYFLAQGLDNPFLYYRF